jgi:hypothetical protein
MNLPSNTAIARLSFGLPGLIEWESTESIDCQWNRSGTGCDLSVKDLGERRLPL